MSLPHAIENIFLNSSACEMNVALFAILKTFVYNACMSYTQGIEAKYKIDRTQALSRRLYLQ